MRKHKSHPATPAKHPQRQARLPKPMQAKDAPISASIYKSQQKFFEVAYEAGMDVWSHSDDLPFLNDFISVLTEHLPPTSMILDLGCGRGMNAIRLAKRGFRIWAIDSSGQAIQMAAQEAKKSSVGKYIAFKKENFLTFKTPRHFFDAALDRGCLHHIRKEDWPKYLKNLKSMLKPKSYFFLVTFSDKSPCFHPRRGHGQVHTSVTGIPHAHYDYFFSPEILYELFHRHFSILKIRHRADKPYSFYYTLMRAK